MNWRLESRESNFSYGFTFSDMTHMFEFHLTNLQFSALVSSRVSPSNDSWNNFFLLTVLSRNKK
jgi:hypothetical protein